MSERLPVVHIGWSRAGSKWLQEVVFPRMHRVASPWPIALWRDLTWKLGTAEDDAYYENTLRAFVHEFAVRHPDETLLYTQNEISGYYLDPPRTMWRSADRLKRLFPEAKILVVTRRQDRILPALHGLYVRTGGHRPLSDLLDGQSIEGWKWDRSYLEFDRSVGRYVELYGRENVKVLPHDLALADPDRFLRDLAAFVGTDGYDDYDAIAGSRVNSSFSPITALALRTWNRLFVKTWFNESPLLGARSSGVRMHQILNEKFDPVLRRLPLKGPSRSDREKLGAFAASYGESNARLQAYCDYPLAELGYRLADTGVLEMEMEAAEEAERREVPLP